MTNSRLYQTKLYRYFVLPLLSFFWIGILVVMGVAYMATGVRNYWGFTAFVPGVVLFLIAKAEVIKSGRLFSFGVTAAERMSKLNKIFYYSGYALMILGFFLIFAS